MKDATDETPSTAPPPSRLVMSGRCTFEEKWLLCKCPYGVFGTSLDTNTIEPKCKECAHLLSFHEDVNIASAQSQSEGMSLLISIISLTAADGPVVGVGPSDIRRIPMTLHAKPRWPHSGIKFNKLVLFMFEVLLQVESPHWPSFSMNM